MSSWSSGKDVTRNRQRRRAAVVVVGSHGTSTGALLFTVGYPAGSVCTYKVATLQLLRGFVMMLLFETLLVEETMIPSSGDATHAFRLAAPTFQTFM